MDPIAHSFPLPEAESGKLAVITEELSHQPLALKFNDTVRANPWQSILCAFGFGLLLSLLFRRL